ncbi:MAG: TatD family hydrolase [Chloroflexota bacterium]
MYKVIDTHTHLEQLKDVETAIIEAKAAGVNAIIAVGEDYESDQKVLALSQTYPGFIYAALGLHPWFIQASELDRTLAFIEAHIGEAIAVGEVGLDYDKRVRAKAEKDLQIQALRAVLKIARTYRKPVSMHTRYAWRDSLDLVNEAQLEKVVFHWYTGTSSVLRDIVNLGYLISATPAVEYHEEHRRAVKEAPLEKLLLETDCPVIYRRGTEFEYEARPIHVFKSLKGATELKGVSEAHIAEVTTDNAVKFFGL